MSDIKLFRFQSGRAVELQSNASDLERPLQTLIEANLDTLLGIRFLATEYSTGKTHAGRIDSLGLDENNCPVILEYKRSVSENVINQGLFYLDWLMDHQAEFKLMVMDKLGKPAAEAIDWLAPRLVCIAADFTKYDSHAVQQINRNVELIRYRRFGEELLLLELANASSATSGYVSTIKTSKVPIPPQPAIAAENSGIAERSIAELLSSLPPHVSELMASLEGYVLSLGDDVQRKELKQCIAYKRLKNFASVVPRKAWLLLYLHVDPDQLKVLPSNGRNVRQLGHWGTGDLELVLASQTDLEAAKPLIMMAFEGRKVTVASAAARAV